MIVKFLKDHLPWVAPSAAIVFAASGYFDRGSEPAQVAQAPISYDVNAPALPQTSQNTFEPNQVDVVTRLSTVTDSSLQLLQPKAATPLELAVAKSVEPKIVAAPEPVAKPAVQTASLEATESAAAFFADAQAKLLAQESCVGDLRALSEQARVYFPAGGLTADESGIEQARLIGSLVQDCAGVQIIVEGHSDPSGNADVNLRLSKKRAEQVIQRLGASGFDTSQFIAKGLGSQNPSKVIGPESAAYYDRRVEFVVIETEQNAGARFNSASNAWSSSSCVNDLRAAVTEAQIFYAPRSVAAKPAEINTALELASKAMACPNARLRVIGQHSDDLRIGENPATGRLRAKAMMAMLVGKGIDSEQIIIAAPSRSMSRESQSGSRLDFDVILD